MEIFRSRMRDDNIMFAEFDGDLESERSNMIEMMRVMETIGIVIDYPGLREMMQKGGELYGFRKWREGTVRDFARGTSGWSQWECREREILSRNSCIGDKAANEFMKNVREFIEIWGAQAVVE